jgi:mono/diheme cytochrome c family protein
MIRIVRAGLLMLTMLTEASSAQAQEVGDVARGRAYAQSVCAECHAVLPSQSLSPRTDVATFKTIAQTPGMTAMALSVWFRTPHPTMPNFLISPQDQDDVIAYILSLRER